MENFEYLTLLKQGSAEWNKWRHANPSIKPDLHKADLSCADISGANLYRYRLKFIFSSETWIKWLT